MLLVVLFLLIGLITELNCGKLVLNLMVMVMGPSTGTVFFDLRETTKRTTKSEVTVTHLLVSLVTE